MGKERHSNRFTQAQKNALLKAVLIDQKTPTEAWRAAIAGQLGMPAFDPGRRYVYTLVKRGREQFEHEHGEALANTTHQALIRLHRLALDHALALDETSDLAAISKAAKTLADTEKALNAAKPPKPPQPPGDTNGDTDANTSAATITSLLDKTQGSARTGSQSRSRNAGVA